MRKSVLFVAALLFMAVPVMAVSNVTITCTDDDVNMVTVSYTSNLNRIRAFGLDITVTGANITQVVPVDANYRIFPGQIVITDGNVTDYGTCYDPCDLGDGSVTVEMGSLYTEDPCYAGDPNLGYGMKPGLGPSPLLKFYVGGDCNYVVDVNVTRGGVVMEDPTEEPNVTLCSGTIESVPPECYAGMADYAQWVEVNKPECWCYPRQCHGDADGKKTGSDGKGWVYVEQTDLDIMSLGWMVKNPPKGPGILNLQVNGVPVACADFAHDKEGSDGKGWTRISQTDLDKMSLYWLVKEPPKGTGTPADCLPGNRTPP